MLSRILNEQNNHCNIHMILISNKDMWKCNIGESDCHMPVYEEYYPKPIIENDFKSSIKGGPAISEGYY
ncbi:hypothetical protein ACTFIT_012189 [Dictyostelium discoideum]